MMMDERDKLRAEIERLREALQRLREALRECADELEVVVEDRYKDTKDYPSEKRRYDRDIAPVLRARDLLSQ
jgi:predicted  nucleic acid-binding Zn-ribbon protein